MNNIQVFNNPEFGNIRTVEIDGKPYFVGKDVADTLKYQNGSRDINRHVDEEDRRKMMIFDGNQNKETIVINESGLYSLILSSKLPSARRFKHWVTSEVLPAIRKHGVLYKIRSTPKQTNTERSVFFMERSKTIQNNINEGVPKGTYPYYAHFHIQESCNLFCNFYCNVAFEKKLRHSAKNL